MTVQLMMVLMFKFFFSESILDAIAAFTNAKATEMVYKKKVKRSDGKFYYEVISGCCVWGVRVLCVQVCSYDCRLCLCVCFCLLALIA